MIITGKQRRYLNAGSSQSAASLAAGRVSGTIQPDYARAENTRFISFQSDGGVRTRGVILGFMGVGPDDGTFNYRVWIARKGSVQATDGTQATTTDYELQYFGGGAATLSTAVGQDDAAVVRTGERIADTLTWTAGTAMTTPKGVGSLIEATLGGGIGSAMYSPENNTPATLIIPDVGCADGMVVEFNTPSAGVTRMNCHYEMVS